MNKFVHFAIERYQGYYRLYSIRYSTLIYYQLQKDFSKGSYNVSNIFIFVRQEAIVLRRGLLIGLTFRVQDYNECIINQIGHMGMYLGRTDHCTCRIFLIICYTNSVSYSLYFLSTFLSQERLPMSLLLFHAPNFRGLLMMSLERDKLFKKASDKTIHFFFLFSQYLL